MNFFEKYKEYIAKNDWTLGKATGVEHILDTQGHESIRSRPIHRSQSNHTVANEELQKLLSSNLLVPIKSSWACPLLIVRKKLFLIRW